MRVRLYRLSRREYRWLFPTQAVHAHLRTRRARQLRSVGRHAEGPREDAAELGRHSEGKRSALCVGVRRINCVQPY